MALSPALRDYQNDLGNEPTTQGCMFSAFAAHYHVLTIGSPGVTSPPYFNLKPYASEVGGAQLGRIDDYEAFLEELDKVWSECERVLVPGGRVCCVIRDILIPRRADGRHRVLPLPSDIQVRSRKIGLDNLTPILWFKIGNRTNEAGGGSSGYYGKPYQPGGIIKNDHEHILMLRKPGGYRTTPMIQKALSMLQRDEMVSWMRPVCRTYAA